MTVQVQVINAFSIDGTGGNPAGVVFNADAMSTLTKQSIATAAGFPETAFVSASAQADFKLDFFTPTRQIPHCGHATIATFSYLKSIGRIAGEQSSKETIDGCRTIVFKEGLAFMEQRAPKYEYLMNLEPLLQSLQITEADLLPGTKPAIVNTGNSFLIVPVRNETILSGIRIDASAVYRLSEQYNLIGYYLYTNASAFDATTRMFAPFYGIDEEAATGMAAGPLATYLWEHNGGNQTRFRIEQGKFLYPSPSPSLLHVDLEIANDKIVKLFAGGDAYVSRSVAVEIP